MKIRSQFTFASLALLITEVPCYTHRNPQLQKVEPTQNVSSSLQTSTQRGHNSVKQAMQDTLQLGFPGILAKTSEDGKRGVMPLG
ncbi:hypothetical protein KEH51_22175 [[Brevibacterium] frigoritolerans]|uniref:Uncharacterized protein n=1 Tax=Peribacillus frigoritolerans TaxID=450367 RepID=A0A941FTA3_9BACI|nr:hypothetical protein [Peribacillus frigoritolerans]